MIMVMVMAAMIRITTLTALGGARSMVDTCGHGAGDVCQEYMRDHVMPVLVMSLPARRCPT